MMLTEIYSRLGMLATMMLLVSLQPIASYVSSRVANSSNFTEWGMHCRHLPAAQAHTDHQLLQEVAQQTGVTAECKSVALFLKNLTIKFVT